MKESSTKKKKRSTSSSSIKVNESKQQQQQQTTDKVFKNVNNVMVTDVRKETTSLHYYLHASNKKFKEILKAAFVGGKDILQWCKSKENLKYLREHTRLLDRVYYLKLEQDLWQNYIQYGETYSCWTLPLSKTIIEQNQLTSDYHQSKTSMEKYQLKIEQQLKEAEQYVHQHTSLLKHHQHKDSTINIDEQRLWAAALGVVRRGQHKLRQSYEHRKIIFKLCAKDNHLVRSCYNCQPTEDEIISMQIIWQATINESKSQEEVDILKQHIYIKRLPKSFDYLDQSFSKVNKKLARPVYNDNIRTSLLTNHQKIIAQNKCDLMRLYISMAEAAVQGYYQYGENEKQNLINRMKQNPRRKSFVEQLIKAIEDRQKYIRNHIQYLTRRRIHFFYRRSDDRRTKCNRRSYHLNSYWNILPSSPIIEVSTKLTSEQLALIARGPKYVPPCQSRFYTKEKRDRFIQQEYKTIMNKILEFFRQHSYCVSERRIKEFSIDLENLLKHLHTKKLSRKLLRRAKREHKLIIKIRQYLHRNPQVILRRTDKSKVFHLGDASDYQRKVLQYMHETEAYEELTSGISPLSENLEQVKSSLNRLFHTTKPSITRKQYESMYPKEANVELAHLYFLPKPHKVCSILVEIL